jgi:hypothetical protein
MPGQGRSFTVVVPQDGRIGMLSLMVAEKPRAALKFKARLKALFGGNGDVTPKEFWIWCDEVIQCPRVRPDGLVEPPRVLSKAKGKQ